MIDPSAFYGPNEGYVLDLYERYLQDPESVDPKTRQFFQDWTPPSENGSAPAAAPVARAADLSVNVDKIVSTARLARMIREVGHLAANIDPLGSNPPGDPGLKLSTHGLHVSDLAALPARIIGGPLAESSKNALEAIGKLRLAYSGSIGYEDDHIQIAEELKWIRSNIEAGTFFQGFDDEYKRALLMRLTEVEVFERYLHTTFIGQKRFSIEGTDMLIPMLDYIIKEAAQAGVREVIMGMAHRGRLNVLAHVLGKPYKLILSEFHSAHEENAAVSEAGKEGWSGDVKYHMGYGRNYQGEHEMPITLASNPSHLEYVDPVVMGRTRAAQEIRSQPGAPLTDPKAAGAILIHGDAAFPGQGVVTETLNLAQLPGYKVGGTIHIITNNQIGFTTNPRDSRSTLYASDPAKGYEIPIVHVNADDPIACIAATRMAYGYCVKFHKDFLIDLVGYRRWGHNEGDEPAFTQPRMYYSIAHHPTVRELWARELEREKIVTPEEAQERIRKVQANLQEARNNASGEKAAPPPRPTATPPGKAKPVVTALTEERLIRLNDALLARPEGFTLNPKLERTLGRRKSGLLEEGGIDWGHAESLAFGAILEDGIPIRFTGQDIERGTFSHRHLALHDPFTGRRFIPLQALPDAKASFAVHNSPLSEMAVLGFEYGYNRHAPGTLVLWEAQFGDFANSAQVIIDQFLVSGHAKWRQTPTLVLLLPHGYEGQGPEHSSARLERFLQLCANDNLRVVSCTTSAQYFHALRRQAALLESAPRPLIVMSPKSLLRNPRAGSSLADLTVGRFMPVLDDDSAREHYEKITRIVFCSGKVYVDLTNREEYSTAERIAVVRVEELYPLPAEELDQVIAGYPNAREFVWLQEEPRNMGAWSFVEPRFREVLPASMPLIYVGRRESASPAEGSIDQHNAKQTQLLLTVLTKAPEIEKERPEGEKQRSEVTYAR